MRTKAEDPVAGHKVQRGAQLQPAKMVDHKLALFFHALP